MKCRFLAFFCILTALALLSGCGAGTTGPSQPTQQAADDNEVAGEMPAVVNTGEYSLYQNIFFNDQKGDYAGKDTVKKGTFTCLYDAFSNVTRYYVWGYNDWTKCCDWQWELKVDDASDLPTNGSLIQVRGTYEENESALDKFWIVNPKITVEETFAGRDFDIDMQSMDDTLERVQAANIVRNPEAFEGKTVCCYGRILNQDTVQDPYYDNSWQLNISGDFEVPAFGTLVLVSGTIHDAGIVECEIAENTQY